LPLRLARRSCSSSRRRAFNASYRLEARLRPSRKCPQRDLLAQVDHARKDALRRRASGAHVRSIALRLLRTLSSERPSSDHGFQDWRRAADAFPGDEEGFTSSSRAKRARVLGRLGDATRGERKQLWARTLAGLAAPRMRRKGPFPAWRRQSWPGRCEQFRRAKRELAAAARPPSPPIIELHVRILHACQTCSLQVSQQRAHRAFEACARCRGGDGRPLGRPATAWKIDA
jgi:hypothetical protein